MHSVMESKCHLARGVTQNCDEPESPHARHDMRVTTCEHSRGASLWAASVRSVVMGGAQAGEDRRNRTGARAERRLASRVVVSTCMLRL